MRVIKPSTLARYWQENPKAESHLREWLKLAKAAEWKNPIDVRDSFPDVDRVLVASGNTVYVFNIGGAHRMIAAVKFKYPMVYVLRLMTHKEYDKDKWKAEL